MGVGARASRQCGGTVVCSTPSPLVPMRDRVTGSTLQVREQRCGSLAGQEAGGR